MKIFQRAQRSLFGEILDWLLTPLLLLVPVSIGVTWLVAQGIANAPYDRELQYNVQTLGRLVAQEPVGARFTPPTGLRALLAGDDADTVYFQVVDSAGELIAGDADLPPPSSDERPVPGTAYLRDAHLRGQGVRVGYLWLERGPHTAPQPDGLPARAGAAFALQQVDSDATGALADLAGAPPRPAGLVLVQVAETRGKQSMLSTEIVRGVLLPQFAILPLAVLLIWLALVRGIKPLSSVEDRIRERRPDDLSPLDESVVPLEVVPLVSSVNELLGKLNDSMATQKRFLADAAHQLKTPLAGLRMQADLAQRDNADAEELKKSLKQIGRASVRATHTVNQLLALARAEGGIGTLSRQTCDLTRLTMEVVHEMLPRAMDKGLDLGYDGAQPGAPGVELHGNATLLRELIRNLLDNALNYTPSTPERPGVVTARVLADPFGHVLLLQVEDSGPGIADNERELVFEPFYRVLGNEADGSGLGLPIVREIAQQHRASVELEDAHPGHVPPGTRFTVRFDTSSP